MRRVNFLTGLLLAAVMVLIGGGAAMAQTFTATVGGIKWECIPLGNTPTCSVKPEDKSAISGAVTVPAEVVNAGGEKFSVTVIGGNAFSYCRELTAVKFPSSVTQIGRLAFAGCRELTAVTIPSSVTEIGEEAFAGCSKLKAINVDDGNPSYCAIDGVLLSRDKKTLVYCPEGKTGAYEIPNGVIEIGGHAFAGCIELTAVTIPSGVTHIGEWAFTNCYELNEVYWLAEASIEVGNGAFANGASPATLYVRPGEKAKIEANGKDWWESFSIEEGYLVVFEDSDGRKLGEQLVKPNGAGLANASAAPTKEGYTIAEWQLDGKKYDFSTPVTQDITLRAVWKKNEAAPAPTPSDPSNPTTPSDPSNPSDPSKETAVESVLLAGARIAGNPFGSVLALEGVGSAERVEVYSLQGVLMHAQALRGESRVEIRAQGWAQGVYVVRVAARDGEKCLKGAKR